MSAIRIQCKICQQFINAAYINSHLKSCGLELTCRICGKTYCTPQYLKQHELSHNKSYVQECLSCAYCKSKFCAVSSLNKHKKTCPVLLGKNKAVSSHTDKSEKAAHIYLPKKNDFIIKTVAENVKQIPEEVAAVDKIIHCDDYSVISQKIMRLDNVPEFDSICQEDSGQAYKKSNGPQYLTCHCNTHFSTYSTFGVHQRKCAILNANNYKASKKAGENNVSKRNDYMIERDTDNVIHFSDDSVAAIEEIQSQDYHSEEHNVNYKRVKIQHVQQFTKVNQKHC